MPGTITEVQQITGTSSRQLGQRRMNPGRDHQGRHKVGRRHLASNSGPPERQANHKDSPAVMPGQLASPVGGEWQHVVDELVPPITVLTREVEELIDVSRAELKRPNWLFFDNRGAGRSPKPGTPEDRHALVQEAGSSRSSTGSGYRGHRGLPRLAGSRRPGGGQMCGYRRRDGASTANSPESIRRRLAASGVTPLHRFAVRRSSER